MNVIFVSPFTSLWRDELESISAQINADIISLGNLLRAELKTHSELASQLESSLKSGNIVSPELISSLVIERVIKSSESKILVDFPRTYQQSQSLSEKKDQINGFIRAIVVVDGPKEKIFQKFLNKYHCKKDHTHPRIESAEASPKCSVCNAQLEHTYSLENEQIKQMIEAYYKEHTGQLACAKDISNSLGLKYIEYTSPEKVSNEIMLCSQNA